MPGVVFVWHVGYACPPLLSVMLVLLVLANENILRLAETTQAPLRLLLPRGSLVYVDALSLRHLRALEHPAFAGGRIARAIVVVIPATTAGVFGFARLSHLVSPVDTATTCAAQAATAFCATP
jgi:hypothetical protein